MLPGLERWLSDNFLLVYDERWQDTYAVKRDTVQTPLITIDQSFDNGVDLVGADIIQTALKPNDRGYISFYWRIDVILHKPFKTFIHLRDENGENVLQLDRFPFNGELPFEGWPLGTVVKETIWFYIPETLEAKEYTFYVGLYDPDTLERVPLEENVSEERATSENAILAGEVLIK